MPILFVDVVKTFRFVWGWHSELQQILLFHHLWSGGRPLMFVSLGFASVLTVLNSSVSTMTAGVHSRLDTTGSHGKEQQHVHSACAIRGGRRRNFTAFSPQD